MKPSALVFFLFVFTRTFAQPSVLFQDCTDIRANVLKAGDSVVITCDTAYIMNAMTFRLYDNAYRDIRRKAPSVARLMAAYDEIIALQERRLQEQEANYNNLRTSFETLSIASGSAFEQASKQLNRAMNNLETLSFHLQESNRLLTETRTIIEAEKRGLNLDKLLWGAGGLTAGLIMGVLISR